MQLSSLPAELSQQKLFVAYNTSAIQGSTTKVPAGRLSLSNRTNVAAATGSFSRRTMMVKSKSNFDQSQSVSIRSIDRPRLMTMSFTTADGSPQKLVECDSSSFVGNSPMLRPHSKSLGLKQPLTQKRVSNRVAQATQMSMTANKLDSRVPSFGQTNTYQKSIGNRSGVRRASVIMQAALAEPETITKQDLSIDKEWFDIKIPNKLLGPKAPEDENKKTLVLSLDDMLVSIHSDPSKQFDFQITTTAFQEQNVYVSKRPHLDKFISEMSNRFELVVKTSLPREVSTQLISKIDEQGLIKHCINERAEEIDFAFNLSMLGRETSEVIIMDPSVKDFELFQNQAIPIKTWKGDQQDNQLDDISELLHRLAVVNDASSVIESVITDNELDTYKVEIFLKPQRIFQFPREWKIPSQPTQMLSDTQMKFRFAHWNILAQKLTNKFIYPQVNESWLEWPHRFSLIKQHLLELDADILGLSELDTLNKELELYAQANEVGKKAHKDVLDFLTNEMGYEAQILEKDSGLCASSIFYKKNKYKCLERGNFNLDFKMLDHDTAITMDNDNEDGDFGILYLKLAPLKPGSDEADLNQQVVIAETHLKAMDEHTIARTAQVNKIIKKFKGQFNDVPVIVAGDFNDRPWTSPIKKMRESFIDLYSLKSIQHLEDKSSVQRQDHEFPDYTLICDIRKAKVGPTPDHRCLDYMFVQENDFFKDNQILVEKYLELPRRQYLPSQEGQVATLAIPGPEWPSDHFSMVYDLNIVYGKDK